MDHGWANLEIKQGNISKTEETASQKASRFADETEYTYQNTCLVRGQKLAGMNRQGSFSSRPLYAIRRAVLVAWHGHSWRCSRKDTQLLESFLRKLFRQAPKIGLRGTCGGCLKLD